jgi:hypothetical protein
MEDAPPLSRDFYQAGWDFNRGLIEATSPEN